ncbi:MAG: L,D-transpeptidase [Solirubrobacterales bacterium]
MDRASSKTLVAWLSAALLALIPTAMGLSAASAGAEPAVAEAADAAPADYTDTLLSNELDTSRWAFVTRKTIAYSEPKAQGRKVRKLTTRTPDRTNELVLALVERKFNDGSVWVQVRLPMRGSGKTGWVRRGALANYNVIHTRMVISRNRFTATLYKNEKVVWKTRVGVGAKGTATPTGHFYVRDRLITNDSHGPYGPYAFGLSAYSSKLTDWPGGGIIGIHGTNEPGKIPGRISHGCIRVKNAKVRRLYKLLPPGTPVEIK